MAEAWSQFLAALDVAIVRSVGSCPVCLEEYKPDRLPTTNTCGHSFCDECTAGLQKHGNKECPVCRATLMGGTKCLGFRQLLLNLWDR
ncbi:hypothetical protein E1B28_008470 [Marasmius oreades]|uniref:RING-type domain-containing protein n=1 Tax=Marasmius oreades TaxID=181124 RepID=A0A9P7RYE0_9AGAR|nr:uncharacterized protein E1B28_008470 [Marasmius oreades]KAG7092094.1 hypothetical protein E1B28_008470 [Marasmius oreades]